MTAGNFRLASLSSPCETLTGFFYDLAWREDCAVLLVADVMGTGVEAALATMLVKAAFAESAGGTGDPAALVCALRFRLHRLMPRRTYVGAVVARLSFDGPDIDVANAGLPRPFVLRAAERHVEDVALDGVPLGLFLDCDPQSRVAGTVSLAPGDLLFISTTDTHRVAVGRRDAQGAARS